MASTGGTIYAIGAKERSEVKIGSTTTSVESRLRALQTGYPWRLAILAVVPVPATVRRIERQIHALLASHRLSREWFHVTIDTPILTGLVEQAQALLGPCLDAKKDASTTWFGKRLQHARIERGISQHALATQAQMRQSHLSMLENAHHYPNVGVVRRLVHALGVNADYLLGLTNTMTQVTYEELEPEEECKGSPVVPCE
jgi:DNA-binding XRE family transcriptional regulator